MSGGPKKCILVVCFEGSSKHSYGRSKYNQDIAVLWGNIANALLLHTRLKRAQREWAISQSQKQPKHRKAHTKLAYVIPAGTERRPSEA